MIDKKIKLLGGKFRGLWQIRERHKTRHGHCIRVKWYVTFKYNGDYLESRPQDTIGKALDYAINYLGL